MSKWLSFSCLAGLAMAQTGAPVQPTFRVGTRLVQVDVVVLDNKTPVRGLTKDDFTVTDKGKPQDIAVFSVVEAHNAPKADPLADYVASNRINNRGESTSGATVILFDKMNMASSDQVTAGRQALQLLSKLKQTDRVAFYSLTTDLTMVQDFTDGSERLANAAKAVLATGQAAAGSPENQALIATLRSSLDPFRQNVSSNVKLADTMNAFRAIVRHLDGLPGRKNLIWLTASIPFTYGIGANRRDDDQAEFDRMERLMSESNVAVYAVDPRGAGASDGLMGGGGGGAISGPRTGDDNGVDPLTGNQGMREISDNTGGKAYYDTNDLTGALREVLDTTEVTYTLGFYVDDKALDNKTHNLTVKLAKKPETAKATLHYRKSYEALKPEKLAAQAPIPAIAVLAADALDASAIGVMAAAAPNPDTPGSSAVQVRIDVEDLTLERKDDKWTGAFDLALAMQGAGSKPADMGVKTYNLSLTDDQLKDALSGGLTIDSAVPTPARPMRLRVVVQDKASGAAGSVRIPIGTQQRAAN